MTALQERVRSHPIGDAVGLQRWFNTHVAGKPAPIFLTRVPGGASNLLYAVSRGDERFILRRPPMISNDPSANNISREARVLGALSRTNIPHAKLVAVCADPSIIGAPFLVSAWVDGFNPWDPMPEPFSSDAQARREMGFEIVDALSLIANADWRNVGLVEFGKPEGFLERQVDRWLGQWARYRTRTLDHADDLASWLQDNMQKTQRHGLVHGDFSFANLMFSSKTPVRLTAVLDWESSTIGDPILDLGHLLSSWTDANSGATWGRFTDTRIGFPSRAEIAQRYSQATGLDLSRLDFYMVLALFKLALIMEGAHARVAAGKSNLVEHRAMETMVPDMLRQAARIAGLTH